MGLKELLRYESGLTIIPLTNRWSHNEDCGLKEGGAMFFAPGDAREMSCFELRELAVLASGTKGQKRILATFEVDSDSLESGKAKINRTTGNLWHSYTDEYEQEEIYLPYYNKDTAKLIFVDKDFDKTAQYADELISYYSYDDEWYDEDYGEYMSHFEEGTPDGNIDFPYKNRITHMERAMENKRGIDLWDTASDGSYHDVLHENKEPFEEHVRMMTRALCYDIDACNRRFHKDMNELEWVWHPSVVSLIHGANGGESDYEVLFDALEEYGENKMETVENTWESIRESPYLTDNEKTYYEQHSDTYDNASSLKKIAIF